MSWARIWFVVKTIGPRLIDLLNRKRKMPNVPSQAEFDALADRVAKLESLHDPEPAPPAPVPEPPKPSLRKQVNPFQLEMIGGWRLPNKGADGVRDHGLHHVGGGLFVEPNAGKLDFWTIGVSTKNKIHKLTVNRSEIGPHDFPISEWPEAVATGIYDGTLEGVTDLGGARCHGVCKLSDGHLLTSNVCGYATSSERLDLDYITRIEGGLPVAALAKTEGINRQKFGGGFVKIPQWFADEYCQGRTLGLFGGGKHSGQGWGLGPNLAAIAEPGVGTTDSGEATVLLEFGDYDDGTADYCERRFGDYEPAPRKPDQSTALWNFPLPQNGIGFWQADDVPAACWIDDGERSSLVVWSIQGTGQLSYDVQRVGMSETLKTRCYVYSADDLAAVASGQVEPHEVRGAFSEWANPFEEPDSTSDKTWPVGAFWDSSERTLYVLYQAAAGQKFSPAPVLAAYKLN